jgi:hypothetical protein
MYMFIPVLSIISDTVSGTFGDFFTSFFSVLEMNGIVVAGSEISLAFALGAVIYNDIPAEVLTVINRWHKSIDEQYSNINNVVETLNSRQTEWNVPQELLKTLTDNRNELRVLIAKCRSNTGSPADRLLRNTLLKNTVKLCITHVKSWAVLQCYAGVLTAVDVHLLGFFMPGDNSGHRARKAPTVALAQVKVSVINMDYIRVIIDHANAENSAQVKNGWPHGVRHALIVIIAADGVTEVCRQMTSRLHNSIEMPHGSHGKQFIIKAAFLKHVDDKPKFGAEQTFSMPLTTEDLVAKK